MQKQEKDVIVIGGGPAGMMAAGKAAERGFSVFLIEKNEKFGEKLLLTGGGRCNLTNAIFDNRKLSENYGQDSKFLFSVFSRHRNPADVFEYPWVSKNKTPNNGAFAITHWNNFQSIMTARSTSAFLRRHQTNDGFATNSREAACDHASWLVGLSTADSMQFLT